MAKIKKVNAVQDIYMTFSKQRQGFGQSDLLLPWQCSGHGEIKIDKSAKIIYFVSMEP